MGEVKIHQVGTSKMCWFQLLSSTIQFLCISIPETLLHVTFKRRAEISAVVPLVLQEFEKKHFIRTILEILKIIKVELQFSWFQC